MEKVGLFHFVAEPYLMDFRGRVTLPMIGNYLIHAASAMPESVGSVSMICRSVIRLGCCPVWLSR